MVTIGELYTNLKSVLRLMNIDTYAFEAKLIIEKAFDSELPRILMNRDSAVPESIPIIKYANGVKEASESIKPLPVRNAKILGRAITNEEKNVISPEAMKTPEAFLSCLSAADITVSEKHMNATRKINSQKLSASSLKSTILIIIIIIRRKAQITGMKWKNPRRLKSKLQPFTSIIAIMT